MTNADPYYDRGYHRTHYKAIVEDGEYFQSRAELALNYWEPSERGLRIFDYGCGLGYAMAMLPNAEGWDVSSEARELCRQRGLRVFETREEIPRHSYDRIFCSHVLEHVEQPLVELRIIRELLIPAGRLLLVLPVEDHWIPKIFEPDINQHLYCWTPRTIANLLWRSGFEPVSIEYRYPFGGRRLLPVRRYLGASSYHWAVSVGSRLFKRNGEMVIRAKLLAKQG